MINKSKYCSILAALTFAAVPLWAQGPAASTNTQTQQQPLSAQPAQAPATAAGDQVITRYTFRNVAEKAAPAVVNVKIKSNIVLGRRTQIPRGYGLDEEMREYLERLFKNESWNMSPGIGEDYKYARSGSGVIIREDGYIITSEHVISNVNGDDIEISLPDGRTFSEVEVVGTDKLTDLAVLKINDEGTSNLPHLNWADSDEAQVGDHVLAIGNPLDFTNSVSQGIISAKHRTINKAAIEDLMQTTAMINPGNSGGALVDLDANLIGINMAIATSTGMWSGLGFAIPSKTAKVVAEQIINKGKAIRGYLGIQMRELTIGLARQLGYDQDHGIVVADVTPGTAAEKAGIQLYDIIATVNGKKIEKYSDMHQNIGNLPAGVTVNLEVWRDDGDGKLEKLDLAVELGERPADQSLRENGTTRQRPELPGDKPGQGMLGMKLEPATDGEGLEVKEVRANSATEKADVKVGDVIIQVNRRSVKTVEEFKEALKHSNTGSHMLYIERDGTAMLQMVPGE